MYLKSRQKKLVLCCAVFSALLYGGVANAAFPSYFDYRKEIYTDINSGEGTILPTIWHQQNYGDCWAFASEASYSSAWNLKLKAAGISGTSPDFSERYIAWLAYKAPKDGTWSDKKYYLYNDVVRDKDVYYIGGHGRMAFLTMLRWGNALEKDCEYDNKYDTGSTTNNMKGAESILPSSGSVHDLYCYTLRKDVTSDYMKNVIKDNGGLVITIWGTNSKGDNWNTDQSEYHYHDTQITGNHVVCIVGWNEDYEFQDFTNKDGSIIKGAWIVRNSWGENTGDAGYFYMPINDTQYYIVGSLNPEMDYMRYTQLNTNSYVANVTSNTNAYTSNTNVVSFANKLQATTPQMLKAVTFNVSNDSSSYKIDVLTDMTSPTDGKVVYTQTGTFGTDETLPYQGMRTVDFSKYVFLPENKEYMIIVTLTAPDGNKQKVAYVGYNADSEYKNVSSTAGVSYIYDEKNNKWLDAYSLALTSYYKIYTELTIPTYARAKDSALANGGDFTVCYLNDDGAGGSYINLGSARELYGTDPLHPNRTTLSNMTVDLTKGLTDSVYGGVIFGEGGLTKTGTGTLTLMGDNLYTGDTNINQGTLSLLRHTDGTGGSVQSPVYVNQDGTLTGNGTIYNNLTNSGKVDPGKGIGVLTVNNYLQTATGILNLDGSPKVRDVLNVLGTSYIEGEVHFVPLGYFANGKNLLYVSDQDLKYGTNLTITGEDAIRKTVSIIATSASLTDKSCTFTATRAANAYSNIATTNDGRTLGKALDKVAGYQTTDDGQNLVAGIDFFDYDLDKLGTMMQPRSYDSLMTNNMKNQQFVGKSMVNTMLNGDNYTFAPKNTDEKNDGIFAKALRYSSHQNGWDRYDSYDNMVGGVLVGYERETKGWRYGVHGAYLSGSADIDSAAPLHNDYYSGTVGVHGIKKMDKDFLYGYIEGSWERNEANRKVSYDSIARRQDAEWNGFGFSVEVGGGHNFRSEKRHQSLSPYASLNYSRLHWGSLGEGCSAGDSMSISRGSSNYNSLVGTLGLRAQIGPQEMTGSNAKISYDTTVAYEHEFLNNMSGYDYTILGVDMYQDGYKKPARDMVSVSVGANIMDDKKFSLRAEVGKSWGSQGYSAMSAGLKGQWKF
jgi:autotransporter-associated beta strand protein